MRTGDHRPARSRCLPAAADRPGSRAADVLLRDGSRPGRLRGWDPLRSGGDPGEPALRLPDRGAGGAGRWRQYWQREDKRRRPGDPPLLLPLVIAAGRRAQRPGSTGWALRSRDARRAGPPDARRSSCRGPRHPLRGAVAAAVSAGPGAPGLPDVPGLRSTAGRRDAPRDRAALPQPAAGGAQHPGVADGRLHLRQPGARRALRHPGSDRRRVPPCVAGGAASVGASWAMEAC